MMIARVRKSTSWLAWYFSCTALTDSASIRAWAGSYTPHGRSQWADTVTFDAKKRESMWFVLLVIVFLEEGDYSQETIFLRRPQTRVRHWLRTIGVRGLRRTQAN